MLFRRALVCSVAVRVRRDRTSASLAVGFDRLLALR
jgi:hypothetical protein